MLKQSLSRADIPADFYLGAEDRVYDSSMTLNPEELATFQKRFSEVSQAGLSQLRDFNVALRKTEIMAHTDMERGNTYLDYYFKNSGGDKVKIDFVEIGNKIPGPGSFYSSPRWPSAEPVTAFELEAWPGVSVYVGDATYFPLIQGDLNSLYKGQYIAERQDPSDELIEEKESYAFVPFSSLD